MSTITCLPPLPLDRVPVPALRHQRMLDLVRDRRTAAEKAIRKAAAANRDSIEFFATPAPSTLDAIWEFYRTNYAREVRSGIWPSLFMGAIWLGATAIGAFALESEPWKTKALLTTGTILPLAFFAINALASRRALHAMDGGLCRTLARTGSSLVGVGAVGVYYMVRDEARTMHYDAIGHATETEDGSLVVRSRFGLEEVCFPPSDTPGLDEGLANLIIRRARLKGVHVATEH